MKRMKRPQKEEFVSRLSDRLSSSSGFILTEFTGLDVPAMTELRRKLHQVGVEYLVVKNNLARLAFRKVQLDEQAQAFLETGSTAIVFLSEDPFACPKVLVSFSKEWEALKIKGGMMEGNLLDSDQIKSLAKVSSAEEVYVRLVTALKASVARLAMDLKSILTRAVTVLNEVAKRREESEGVAPPVEEKPEAKEVPEAEEKAKLEEEPKAEEKAEVEEKKPKAEEKAETGEEPKVEEKAKVEEKKPKAEEKAETGEEPKAEERPEEEVEAKVEEKKPKAEEKGKPEEEPKVEEKAKVEEKKPKAEEKAETEEEPKAEERTEEEVEAEVEEKKPKAEEKAETGEEPKVEEKAEVEEKESKIKEKKPKIEEKAEAKEKPGAKKESGKKGKAEEGKKA